MMEETEAGVVVGFSSEVSRYRAVHQATDLWNENVMYLLIESGCAV
jgi:hypothetical protein